MLIDTRAVHTLKQMSSDPVVALDLQHLIHLRHRLHQIPEIGYEEFKTSGLIREELAQKNIEFIEGLADSPTATIAWIGDLRKPCIALRADIDALPIREQTGLPYASTHDGMMHACGHDGHTAILLGTAEVLRHQADRLDVCVKLIFQPAEEGGGGAGRLVRAGVLDGTVGPKVQAIFGLHGWPGLKVGWVSSRPGPILAATDQFEVTFSGVGCHGAFPHLGRDPIVAASEAVINLQHIVSRDIDPTEPVVVTVGTFHAGTATNIIPDTARITGTSRTLTPTARSQVQNLVQRRCHAIASAHDCRADVSWTEGYPPTVNDSRMTEYVRKTAFSVVGQDRYIQASRPSMGGEDFAYYLESVPGCFFMIGVCPEDREVYPSLHSDRFDFTDAALSVGVRMFVNLVRHFQTDFAC
ncbi:MAG: hippurate hydrolase [Phycisphaerae bacterium]|nr:MAG: hippurate hydrolase [Phycisphaerae bacterium]